MMPLGNMRQQGVRSLAVSCGALWCHHQAVLDVSAFADDVAVPDFGPRMVCTWCAPSVVEPRPDGMWPRSPFLVAGSACKSFFPTRTTPTPPSHLFFPSPWRLPPLRLRLVRGRGFFNRTSPPLNSSH